KKSDVNGPDANPIFTYLKSKAGFAGFNKDHKLGKIMVEMQTKNDPNYAENPDIKWNFTKFLISKDGSQIIRFEPTTEPEELAEVIEKLL
ncbi:MAG: glutathione peroxidase, partial [Paludibacteraceae bacterium]|nr:glutathione peroxidase [Paludibacteraceae bacterium]